MKKIWTAVASVTVLMANVSHAQVPYEASVYNYQNSPYNFDNSQYNYKNSPYNFDNSTSNPYAPNAVYDARGNQTGYQTTTDTGVTNYYDARGNRVGYSVK